MSDVKTRLLRNKTGGGAGGRVVGWGGGGGDWVLKNEVESRHQNSVQPLNSAVKYHML